MPEVRIRRQVLAFGGQWLTAVVVSLILVALFLAAAGPVSAKVTSAGLKVRYENLELPAVRSLNAVKLDLAVTPPVSTASIEAAIRIWAKASRTEFSGLSELPVRGAVKRDIASARHWTSLRVADLEAYHDGQFPKRTEGDIAHHNAAVARLDHDFGVGQSG